MDPDELPTRIAGLRVVRVVGAGSRARLVLLQHPDGVLARIWYAAVPRADVDRELAAMARVEHPHLLRPTDAETLADGRVAALVPRIGRGSVLRLLERRGELSFGEAVTLVAPIADAVDALHRAGVCHGRIAPARVLLDDAGAPVLTGFGAAALFDRGLSPSAREPTTALDTAALRDYLDRVLEHVTDARAAAVRERLDSHVGAEPGRAIRDALFGEGSGAPLRFPDADERSPVLASGRVGEPRRAAGTAVDASERGPAVRLAALLDGGASGARSEVLERWSALPRPRRLLVLGAGAAIATAVSAAVLVPAGEDRVGGDRVPGASRTAAHADAEASRSASPSSPDTAPVASPDPADFSAVVRGADPLAAVAVLVDARERCIREGDIRGLAAVDESGSTADQDDREAIAGRRQPLLPDGPFRLVETLGDAAVVESTAQRILVIRTGSGWRIREVTAAGSGVVP